VRVTLVTMVLLAVRELLDSREIVVSLDLQVPWECLEPLDPLDPVEPPAELETVESLDPVVPLELLELLELWALLEPLESVARREVLETREREA